MPRSTEAIIREANAALLVDADHSAVAEFFAADYLAHLTGRNLKGHAGVRRFLKMLHAAFPKISVDVEILTSRADRIAWQRTLRATHKGEYAGFSATHRRVVWREVAVSRIERGAIAEDWIVSDLAERLLLARKR